MTALVATGQINRVFCTLRVRVSQGVYMWEENIVAMKYEGITEFGPRVIFSAHGDILIRLTSLSTVGYFLFLI